MSDKASQEYINSQIESDYRLSAWMVDQELQDNNWEDLQPDHLADGETVETKQVKTIYKQEKSLS